MVDKFVTFNESRPRTGLPSVVDAKIESRYATKAELAAIDTGGVVSPSVSRIIASSDPDTPLSEGDLLLLYAPPLTHFEDWSDGLAGWKNLWTDEPWTVATAGGDSVAQITKSGTARVALAYDSDPLSAVEIVARIRPSEIDPSRFTGGLGVGVTGPVGSENAYMVTVFQNAARLIHMVPGSFTTYGWTTDYVPSTGETYWSRLRLQDGTLSARLWADGTPEPSAWQLTTNGVPMTQGHVALMPGTARNATQYFQVGIAELDTGNETAPVVTP